MYVYPSAAYEIHEPLKYLGIPMEYQVLYTEWNISAFMVYSNYLYHIELLYCQGLGLHPRIRPYLVRTRVCMTTYAAAELLSALCRQHLCVSLGHSTR